MTSKTHVGFSSLHAERKKLLSGYDLLKASLDDDPIKVEHGIKGEAHFRRFLKQFLPKKYGVTKGYIITTNSDYNGPLEEWDIIIYDALESPVLFVRENEDTNSNSQKRGIPVEYVRAVIEVKATFNKTSAGQVTKKLLKLRQFTKGGNTGSDKSNDLLKNPFIAFAVFYEVILNNKKDFLDALKELTPFRSKDPLIQFIGGLILRANKWPDYSAEISMIMNGEDNHQKFLVSSCEVCEAVPSFVEGMNVSCYSTGFGENVFWNFLMNLVHHLNGQMEEWKEPINFTAPYGRTGSKNELKPLFV